MGVYINMEMPSQGEFKHIRIYDNGDVTVEVEGGEAVIAHAVPVPPHGDLFDISKVKITPSDDEDIAYEIDFGNTIIPAEEGD